MPFPHPEAVFTQTTTACNARCTYCPHPFTYGKRPIASMPEEVWAKIVKDLQTMRFRGQVGLYLHCEPLLDSELPRRIRQINDETEAFVVLSTNGARLHEANREKLIAARPRLVHVNIVSAMREQYERLTGLSFMAVVWNTKRFIQEAADKVRVEINCPVLPGVDTDKIVQLFPEVPVNVDFWANSRGGLLKGVSSQGKHTRFSGTKNCFQTEQNFNILHDGSVLLCCSDWAQETKGEFPNVMEKPIAEIYQQVRGAKKSKYSMCQKCSKEMGFGKES
jgi:sulfatase maturation enzyme AslB (radical SAM superfamily)